MANYRYYTQYLYVERGTVLDNVGTSSDVDNLLNFQRQTKTQVLTLSASKWAFRVDTLSTSAPLAFAPFFYGFIDHNFASVGSVDIKLYTGSVDDGATWDQVTTLVTACPTSSEPILFVYSEHGHGTKRYFKIEVSSTPTTDTYCAVFFMAGEANAFTPSSDPKLPRDTGFARTGLYLNEMTGGSIYATSMHGRRRVWNITYEFINSADKSVLEDLEESQGGGLKPFIFTDDGGTTYYYVRQLGDMKFSELASGLCTVQFTLQEEL